MMSFAISRTWELLDAVILISGLAVAVVCRHLQLLVNLN